MYKYKAGVRQCGILRASDFVRRSAGKETCQLTLLFIPFVHPFVFCNPTFDKKSSLVIALWQNHGTQQTDLLSPCTTVPLIHSNYCNCHLWFKITFFESVKSFCHQSLHFMFSCSILKRLLKYNLKFINRVNNE